MMDPRRATRSITAEARRYSTTILTRSPGLSLSVAAEPVEHAEALERAVADRHAAREPLDRVARPHRHHLEAQRLGLLHLGERSCGGSVLIESRNVRSTASVRFLAAKMKR